MLTAKQREQLRGLNSFENESQENPTYFDFSEMFDNQGIPLFRSEQDPDADRYGVTVTLEDYPANILMYYQYFVDSNLAGYFEHLDLTDIPKKVRQYLIVSQKDMVRRVFEALPEIEFNTKLNSRGYWGATSVSKGV